MGKVTTSQYPVMLHNKPPLLPNISLLPGIFFPFKALSHLAPIPKCFCSTPTCCFSPQNEAEAMLQLLGWGLP